MSQKFHAVGRRKNAVARVYLTQGGEGAININGRKEDDYFGRAVLRMIMRQPFELTQTVGRFDTFVNCKGGGLTGQAEAIKHGISRALLLADPELRPVLKKAGFLTRDARIKERKKYGLAAARRRFQFSKR